MLSYGVQAGLACCHSELSVRDIFWHIVQEGLACYHSLLASIIAQIQMALKIME
jgi:hypothetical protein